MVPDINIKKITTPNDLYDAQPAGLVHPYGIASAYHSEDISIRTQVFKITLYDIPKVISSEFEKYNSDGQLHFIKGNGSVCMHSMFVNAQHLITMSRSLLCVLYDADVVKVMRALQDEIFEIDPALASRMQPDCVYKGGLCSKGDNCCGYMRKANINEYKRITETINQ